MNKQKLILVSFVGLLLVGLVFYVLATKADKKDAGGKDLLMKAAGQEFTYADLMAELPDLNATGDSIQILDSVARLPVVQRQQQPPPEMVTTESAAAISDIRQRLKEGQGQPLRAEPATAAQAAAEDAYIRDIVGKIQSKTPPVEPKAPASPTAAPPNQVPATTTTVPQQVAPSIQQGKPLRAVVLSAVEVVEGSGVSIMLLESGSINGMPFGKNLVLPGIVSIQGNRLMIHITECTINGNLVEVNISAYDLEGRAGLRIQGEKRGGESIDAAKQEVERGVEGAIGNTGVLGGVVRVIKTFSNSSKKEEVVMIPAGHKILLKPGTR